VREGLPQISHPISHRTPHYRMGKDSIRLLAAIKKRPNFRTQHDCKIQDEIDSNSLGNRCSIRLSYGTKRLIYRHFLVFTVPHKSRLLPILLPSRTNLGLQSGL
jgi:hypothetical protein